MVLDYLKNSPQFVRAFQEGSCVFHDCPQEGVGGTPSAFILKSKRENNPMLYCFACETALFILRTHAPPLYECRINETLPKGTKLNIAYEKMYNKWNVLDADCGAGKHTNTVFSLYLISNVAHTNTAF